MPSIKQIITVAVIALVVIAVVFRSPLRDAVTGD